MNEEIQAGRRTDERITVEVMGGRPFRDGGAVPLYRQFSRNRYTWVDLLNKLAASGVFVEMQVGCDSATVKLRDEDGVELAFEIVLPNAGQDVRLLLPLAICRATLDPLVLAHLHTSTSASEGS